MTTTYKSEAAVISTAVAVGYRNSRNGAIRNPPPAPIAPAYVPMAAPMKMRSKGSIISVSKLLVSDYFDVLRKSGRRWSGYLSPT